MQKFPEKGFAHIFTILILLAGIVAGLYLIKHPQILRSKAANDQTRIEFVNGKGEIITATNTPNVRIKLTYVFPSITPSPTPTPIPTSTQLGFPNDFKDVTQSTGYRYDAKDNQGVCLHTMKIINNPRGGYLGVYHCSKNDIFSVYLGTSTNVLNWQQVVVIDEYASQPTITKTGNGFLIAEEVTGKPGNSGNFLKFFYFDSLDNLLANHPSAQLKRNAAYRNAMKVHLIFILLIHPKV